MAQQTITRVDVFPDGTVVGAYKASDWSQAAQPPTGAPPGSPVATATMTSGVATLTGLASGTAYYAGAQVSGTWRYVSFTTAPSRLWVVERDRGGIMASSADAAQVLVAHASAIVKSGASAGGLAVFYFDPSGEAVKLKLAASAIVNATAPAITMTYGMYPVATVAGAAAGSLVLTLGTVVPNSTAVLATPAASSRSAVESAEFDAPAAGHYVLGVAVSAAIAANAEVGSRLSLMRRA